MHFISPKKILASLAIYSLFVASTYAEEAAVSIGVVDWRIALFQSKEAQNVEKQMQEENMELLSRATELEQQIETKQRSLEKDQAILSEDERKKLQSELSRSMREYESLRFRLQQVQADTEARFTISQRKNVDAAMKTLAEKYDLDVIFERQALVYGKKVHNLTDELVTELNKLQ